MKIKNIANVREFESCCSFAVKLSWKRKNDCSTIIGAYYYYTVTLYRD